MYCRRGFLYKFPELAWFFFCDSGAARQLSGVERSDEDSAHKCTYDRDLAGGPNLGGKVRYVSDEYGIMDGVGGVDGTVLAYRDIEAKVVELDSRSSPA